MESLLNSEKFEGDSIVKILAIRQHLEAISNEVANNKSLSKLNKEYNFGYNEKRKAKTLLEPNRNELEYNAVQKWNESERKKELDEKFSRIWKDAVKNGHIKSDDFVKMGEFARLSLAIVDKNRSSAYNIYNADYSSKIPVYMPTNVSIWSPEDLPDKWQMYSPPESEPSREPSCYEIRKEFKN